MGISKFLLLLLPVAVFGYSAKQKLADFGFQINNIWITDRLLSVVFLEIGYGNKGIQNF